MDSQAKHPGRKADRASHSARIATTTSGMSAGPSITGTVVGHTPGHVWLSAESTGGGPTDSHMIPHSEGERFPVGKSVTASSEKKNNGTHVWSIV